MLRDLLKCLVRWCKHSVVRKCAVQDLNQVWELVDELGKFGGVFRARNELVNSQVGLVVRDGDRGGGWWGCLGFLVGMVEHIVQVEVFQQSQPPSRAMLGCQMPSLSRGIQTW